MPLMRGLVAAATTLLLAVSAVPVAAEGVADQHRVQLRVFFRAFCPACQWFVGDPLLELVRNDEFRNVVNLKLIPAAGMSETDGVLACDAGPLECTGHLWQACVIDKDRDDVVKYLGTIACIEGDESGRTGDWATKMQNCLTDEERAVVKECTVQRGKELLLEMIRTDHSGSVPWMPYTIVDQKVLGSATEGVGLNTLKASICAAYKGPKSSYPQSCVGLVGEQKEFAAEEPQTADKEKLQPVADAQREVEEVDDKAVANGEEVEGEDGEIVVDMKGEGEPQAPVEAAGDDTAVSGKVQLDLYWRAFCPGCMSFITKPLITLLRDQQFQEVIDFHPVPAAGTSFDAQGNFVCTAGLVECLGHKWLSCVVEEFPKIGELAEHLSCMESKDNKGNTWSFIVNRCFEGDDFTKMKTCYDTKSDELLRKNIAKRQQLSVPWVPYVVVNGEPEGDASHGIGLKQLTDVVCKGYTGPDNMRPSACQPKRLRIEEDAKPADAEDVVKPCPPKKEGAANAQDTQYDDPPSIGKRLADPEPDTVTELEAKVYGRDEADEDKAAEGGTGFKTVVLPGVCFVALGVVAMRLTGDHKKDA